MLEIYNETIHDLLSSNVSVVEIRAQGNKINLHGVNEKEVRSIEDINKIMEFGEKNRTVAATKMNSQRLDVDLISVIPFILADLELSVL